jgi:D-aminoacyl-tRNA deacylase
MKNSLLKMAKLKKEQNLEYEISYECTHHGPSLDSPAMFIELGSSLNQWNDVKAAKVVADAAVAAISNPISSSVVLGIGGPHYNRKFTNMALNDQYAFGHIIPKYALSTLYPEILKKCIKRTIEPVDSVILDWKGIKSEQKGKLNTILDDLDIDIKKV